MPVRSPKSRVRALGETLTSVQASSSMRAAALVRRLMSRYIIVPVIARVGAEPH
jgi:hypothetical protein